jgi:glycosyltransferase involved in cell wall biosynthesis
MRRVEVTHVSPGLFGAGGVWGGGERFPTALARAMSERTPTRLIVFGARAQRRRIDNLEIYQLPTRLLWKGGNMNPISEYLALFVPTTRRLHVHQYHSVVTNLLLLAGRALRRQVFVTDHGGRSYNYADRYSLDRLVTGLLPVSRFSAGFFPRLAERTSSPIFGGADPRLFHTGPEPRQREVVFVGRLMPHKGIDVLIEAMEDDTPLRIFGRAYDPAYRALLAELAAGKAVSFYENASDEDVAAAYRTARVVVLPSVYESSDGATHPWPELLGLTLIEAMASATPVIATRVGGMPEIIEHGRNGFVIEPGDRIGLRTQIARLLDDDALWLACSAAALDTARRHFTWDAVADRCLRAYAELASH